jgi:hypothetical protein
MLLVAAVAVLVVVNIVFVALTMYGGRSSLPPDEP